MLITFNHDEVAEAVFASIRARGLQPGGIQTFKDGKLIGDDEISMQVTIDSAPPKPAGNATRSAK